MVARKDPNSKNKLLSLETIFSTLGPEFLLQGQCHALLAKQQYSCLCVWLAGQLAIIGKEIEGGL